MSVDPNRVLFKHTEWRQESAGTVLCCHTTSPLLMLLPSSGRETEALDFR